MQRIREMWSRLDVVSRVILFSGLLLAIVLLVQKMGTSAIAVVVIMCFFILNHISRSSKTAHRLYGTIKESVYAEAKRRSEELVGQTQTKIAQLRKAGNEYMDDALRQTEETIAKALEDVRDTRMKFRTITGAQEQRNQDTAEGQRTESRRAPDLDV